MYYCTCKSLWIEKASVGKLGVNRFVIIQLILFDHLKLKKSY